VIARLLEAGYDIHGIDIFAEMIRRARKKFPTFEERFECVDFLSLSDERRYDYAVIQ